MTTLNFHESGESQDAPPARERLLQAAVAEFGAKGYAGARTAAIAARARVNPQLIAYYFGGKHGLLDELRRRWTASEVSLVPSGATFAVSVAAYVELTTRQPDWSRLVLWRALGDAPGDAAEHDADAITLRARLRRGTDQMALRQAAGEVTSAVTPEFVLLLAHLVAFAPIALPQFVEGIFGVDPYSAEYRQLCVAQLLALLEPTRSGDRPAGQEGPAS